MVSLLALCVLALLPQFNAAFFNGPDPNYNATKNLRPENITNLDYRFYQYIGSYSNGTMTFTFSFRNQDPENDDSDRNMKVCSEYIGKTLEIQRNAVVAVAKPSPDVMDGNPVLLIMYVWDKSVNMTGGHIYHDYQHGELYSADPYGSLGRSPYWILSMSNKTRSSSAYEFGGNYSNSSFAADKLLRFNLTQECLPTPGRSSIPKDEEDRYLFEGDLLRPGSANDNDTVKWAGTFPTPAINVVFDANSTSVRITGLFSMSNSGSYADINEVVGVLQAEFHGDIDTERSDELVLRQGKPVWTPSVGFHGQPFGDANEATRHGVGKWWFPFLFLVSVVYVAC